MKKIALLKEILKSDQTVFSFKELVVAYGATIGKEALKAQLHYYVKTGNLYHIRRGLYAKDTQYDRLELATKILIPSYVSFETVLSSTGIIFQYYQQIFVASYQSREIACDDQIYFFRKLKSPILTHSIGIESYKKYSVATKERAFLDTLYVHKKYYFDNLEPLDWEKVYEILPIYEKKTLREHVDELYHSFKKSRPQKRDDLPSQACPR